MSDYISMFYVDAIANPNPDPDDGLANLCLLRVIDTHKKQQ